MKRIMKSTIHTKLAFILGLLFIAVSCQDILDELPENKAFTDETDYTISDNMILPLVGSYAEFYTRGWEQLPLLAVRGDDVNKGGQGDQTPMLGFDNFTNYDKDYWMLNSAWQGLYQDIYKFQVEIEEIEKYMQGGANAALGEQYIAEINTLKSYLLLQLGRGWGNILLPTTSSPSDLLVADITPRDEVFQYIASILEEAIPSLPNARPNERTDVRGGVTKYTALALLAKVKLELNDYEGVAAATSEIISSGKFQLASDFSELFKLDGKLNSENLLELQYSDFNQGSGDSKNYLFAFFGPPSWTPAVAGSSGGWGFWEPSVEYIKFMLDRGEEERLKASVIFTPRGIAEIQSDPSYANLPSWVSNTTPYGDTFNDHARERFFSGKHYMPSSYLIEGRKSYGSNKNMACIRYAEVLLMHAEAMTNGASSAAMTADAAVNLVRERAGLAPLSGVTASQVMDEKFAELAMEWGDRFYDCVRTGNTAPLSRNGASYSDDKRYFPYPQAQVDMLPALSN